MLNIAVQKSNIELISPRKNLAQTSLISFAGYFSKKKVKTTHHTPVVSQEQEPCNGGKSLGIIDLSNDNTEPTRAHTQGHTIDLTVSPTRSCTGVIPLNRRNINEYLNWLFKYAKQDNANAGYTLKLVGASDQANMYSIECTDNGIVHNNRHHPGLRCVNCQDMWEQKGTKLKAKAERRGKLLRDTARCLLVPSLSEDESDVMERFVRTKAGDLNTNGVLLKNKIKSLRSFYDECKVRKLEWCY